MSTSTAQAIAPVEILGTAQRAAWVRKELPPVEHVRPGLWSIPVPMPDNPLRYVLVYALALDEGLALIDVGWPTEDAWHALTDGIRAIGYDVTDVRYAAITHLHPDHFGLAPRLRKASGAVLAMHAADVDPLAHSTRTETARRDAVWNRQLADLGAPPEVSTPRQTDLVRFDRGETIDIILDDGQRLDLPGWNLRALWTPGHTAGHVCFVDEEAGVLLSGDHLLPRISPNISTTPRSSEHPLHRYLLSLHATAALPEMDVLPSHEYRFTGLAQRSRDLLGHHEQRFGDIAEDLAAHPESTAWDITVRMPWSRPFDTLGLHQRRLAVRETDAHLLVLADRGTVRRCAGTANGTNGAEGTNGAGDANAPERWSLSPTEPPRAS